MSSAESSATALRCPVQLFAQTAPVVPGGRTSAQCRRYGPSPMPPVHRRQTGTSLPPDLLQFGPRAKLRLLVHRCTQNTPSTLPEPSIYLSRLSPHEVLHSRVHPCNRSGGSPEDSKFDDCFTAGIPLPAKVNPGACT